MKKKIDLFGLIVVMALIIDGVVNNCLATFIAGVLMYFMVDVKEI